MAIHVHRGDLPEGLAFGASIAVDTETLGLNLNRDRLCLVQISSGDGNAHLVQLDRSTYDAPRLKALLADQKTEKIFHYGRFDLAVLRRWLGVAAMPVYCTKIASRLTRTYTDRHGLKDICRELLGVEISKQQQSSDWGADELTDAQKEYAASDVLYLHRLQAVLSQRLERENRMPIARACFAFLPIRAELDLAGWPDEDIFSHA
ncbi:MAG: ribonuclease D [Rhodobiaceae bacterium]|nr:ribonuclease D [Rhodobiaceae bacterium]MCC0017103.1 ribonuclease D [Rhodobiaceae bacterium]